MIRTVDNDEALEPPITKQNPCRKCFNYRFSYRIPTLRDVLERDRRLLRAILAIVILLNAPIGRYILYPFVIFSTWIHELFHGLAALSVDGKIKWLNIYPDGSGLAYTAIPDGTFQRAWVAAAGYQGTAAVGGIMLMFRRTNNGVRAAVCGIGLTMLFTCILFVRNAFGLAVLLLMGVLMSFAGFYLSPFWVGELYALLAATTCLNAITSIRVLFFVTESSIGGVNQSSDAMTMQDVTKIPYQVWALTWMVFAFWMTAMGVFIVLETKENTAGGEGSYSSGNNLVGSLQEDHLLATEMT